MRFEIDGAVAVVKKEENYRSHAIDNYSVSLFRDKIEREVFYVTLLDVTSQKEAVEILKKEVAEQLEKRKRRTESSVLDDLI